MIGLGFGKQATKVPTTALGHTASEMVFIEGLAVLFTVLMGVALVLPAWLLLGPPSQQGSDVNPLLAACQMGVERGLLGIPGYVAAGLLLVWGVVALLRSSARLLTSTLNARRATIQWARASADREFCLDGETLRFRLLSNNEPLAFTAGFLRPRIFLSQGVFTGLTVDERAAVLRHERAHALARDPLRCLVVAVVFRTVLLPGSGWLGRRYSALREVRADVAAASAPGGTVALLAALTKVVPAAPTGACGITQATLDGIVVIRAGDRTGKPKMLAVGMAAVLVLLAATAAVGLTDWHTYIFCPMQAAS